MQDQPRQDLRALKALVGVMGVLIVLGTALVIGVVIHRLYARNGVASNVAVATVPVPSAVTGSVRLAPGDKIAIRFAVIAASICRRKRSLAKGPAATHG